MEENNEFVEFESKAEMEGFDVEEKLNQLLGNKVQESEQNFDINEKIRMLLE